MSTIAPASTKLPGAVVFDPFTCGLQYCPAGSDGYFANTKDFMPRIGLAWAPEALHGKTAIRAGFGIYYDDSQPNGGPPSLPSIGNFSLSASNIKNLSFPVTPFLGSAAAAAATYSGRNRNRKDVNVDEWTLSIQQEVARETTLNVTYLGTKGTHLLSGTTLNGIDPVTGLRPYASLTSSTIAYSDHQGNLTMEALQAGLQRNLSTGLLISANYQWSHEISDGSTGDAENDTYQNVLCRQCERGAADFDVRHNLTASTIWNVPVGKGHHLFGNASPIVNALLGGWQMSGIGQARTGLPMNITVQPFQQSAYGDRRTESTAVCAPTSCPDNLFIFPATSTGRRFSFSTLPLFPCRLMALGEISQGMRFAPRVFGRSTALWRSDSPVRERMGLSFRADVFNLLNRAQIGKPNAEVDLPGTPCVASGTFGQITTPFTTNPVGTGTARQMQFSLRLTY